ncbi:hypothetical protein BDR26DRAFT_850643 [Obelidium mucronatum]|nr:hypothetical protein BDR26DRAFT_850643 [Obelidium mucronatum]
MLLPATEIEWMVFFFALSFVFLGKLCGFWSVVHICLSGPGYSSVLSSAAGLSLSLALCGCVFSGRYFVVTEFYILGGRTLPFLWGLFELGIGGGLFLFYGDSEPSCGSDAGQKVVTLVFSFHFTITTFVFFFFRRVGGGSLYFAISCMGGKDWMDTYFNSLWETQHYI